MHRLALHRSVILTHEETAYYVIAFLCVVPEHKSMTEAIHLDAMVTEQEGMINHVFKQPDKINLHGLSPK